VIGHSASADVVIDDPFVSGEHALVTVDGPGQVTIRDLNSTIGTFVNGERVTGARVLRAGDLVRMADLVARFETGGAETDGTAPAASGDTQVLASPAMPPETAGPSAAPGGRAPVSGTPVPTATGDTAYTVSGTLLSPALPGIGGLGVQLVDKNVGGDQLLGTTQTGSDGSYSFAAVTVTAAYLQAHHKSQPDLQVQVTLGAKVVASSAVVYSAQPVVTLDVTLPAGVQGLPSEYEVLTANLAVAYPGSLGALQEGNGRHDITYLANKTGWDARAVALAALADQLAQVSVPASAGPAPGGTQPLPVPVTSLRPEFYYALLRAGLPASQDALLRATPTAVQRIWEQATSQGIIPQAFAAEVPSAVAAFQALSAAHLLTAAPPVGLSTLQEMLQATLPDAAQQQEFAQLYVQHQGDWGGFWIALEQRAGLPVAQKLLLMGQLHALTMNNEPLVSALLAAEARAPITSTADLAARGYYEPAKWAPLIGTSVPPSIPVAEAPTRTANYAELLAAQVRLSFPTGVLADQVRSGAMPVVGDGDIAGRVATFLTDNQGAFAIGVEPVQAYLARTGAAEPPADVLAQVSRLQRVYQLTPDDASMAVLLRHNLDSAFAITRYDAAAFTRAFQAKLGGAGTAAAIHARARQIFASTLSIAVAYLSGRVTPSLPVMPSMEPPQQAPAYPVVAYPTLEGLFGSLDYCHCSDCSSMLSPAAYFVDLLNYLDHPAPAKGDNPQDVLLGRRPDLQYLPLTCANTNTALPYIDLVNETLEYFVANGLSLDGYQGHDTSEEITSAELLASPQYVNDDAYDALRTKDAFFPSPLPFNRPLELLRLHLNALGVTLPDAMTALRANDNLSNTASPVSFGWSDILIEQLGISRDEYRLFTDSSLSLGDLWGIPAVQDALTALRTMSLEDFSRRLGVSYDDLIAIIETRFINPNAALIPRLTRLNVPFSTLKTLRDTLNTSNSIAASFENSLPAGLDATEYGGKYPTDYGAVVAWVTDPARYPLIMGIITITGPAGSSGDCSGAGLQLSYSNPDSTANQLTAADYTRLIRFVRLWSKLAPLLGDSSDAVSIRHADAVIAALYPAAPTTPEAGFVTLLNRLGFLVRVMGQLSLTGASLDQLLACWAPIGTAGPGSLYQAMFLTPALLRQDPGAQTATVGPVINVGDVLVTGINGQQVSSYTVQQSDTPASVATAIAQAINAATVHDPDTGWPMNSRFCAVPTASVITVRAGFRLTCGAKGTGAAAPGEAYTPAAASPVSQTATVAGTPTPGDTLTTTIDGIDVQYAVQPRDTLATIAAGICTAINATSVQDPFAGTPLNGLVVATSNANVVMLSAASAGAPFTLTCNLTSAGAGRYTVGLPVPARQQATIAGTVASGDTLVTTINQAAVSYTATAGDTDTAALAAHIAAKVSGASQVDPLTGLPVSGIVQATSAGSTITFTAVDPESQFTLNCQVPVGAEIYSFFSMTKETATATITGPIAPGATLVTTINGLPLVRSAGPADTATILAAEIASDIRAATAADPVTGLPISSVVNATANGTTITVGGKSVTTQFTLAASVSPSQYTAGRQAPPFADDGYGNYLTDPGQKLLGHQPTLCAACNLTAAEFGLITGALGFGPATELTLANVSAVFRFGWLAHTLGLSVVEFLRLREYTGLDPFAPLDPGAAAPAEPPAVRFIRLLGACASAGLTTAQALYLMWNQDITGTSAPAAADVTGLAAALRADFAAVEAQFTVPDEPDGSIAKSLMTLVYGSAASDFFFGLLNGTFSTTIGYSTPAGQPLLPAAVVAASGGRLGYNDLSKQLSYAGLLDDTTANTIIAAVTDQGLTGAIKQLASASQQAVAPFFASYPELLPLYKAYAASADPLPDRRTALLDSFLPVLKNKRKQEQALASVTSAAGTDPSFAPGLLLDPATLHADGNASMPAIADLTAIERQGLSARFFLGNNPAAVPDQAKDAVPVLSYGQTAALGGTVRTGDTLTTTINGVAISYAATAADTTLAKLAASIAAAINQATALDPASTLPIGKLVTATASGPVITLTGQDASGAHGFFTLAVRVSAVSAGAAETYTAGSQLPAGNGGGPVAGTWSGYIAAPQDGSYDICVVTDPGAQITLRVGGTAIGGAMSSGQWQNQDPITLVAGQLTPITLTAASIKTMLAVSWQGQGLGWQPLPGQYLYSADLIGSLGGTYVRFLKAAALASALSLTPAELTPPGTTAGWLNDLTVTGPPDETASAELCGILADLLDFSRMKQALSPRDGRLLAALQDPRALLPTQQPALLNLTGWAQASATALLTQFFGSPDLAGLGTVQNFRRVYDAYAVVRACGLDAATLLAAITNAPTPGTVAALQSALRARYAEPDWLTAVRPINDAARILQRDALVAYILRRLGDSYAQQVVQLTTTATAAAGDTTLSCLNTAGTLAGVTAGMLISGPAFAPGTTVAAVDATGLTLSTGLLAGLPSGSAFPVAPDANPFDSPDRLLDYFLIDVQTQPPVLTSRIRLALSVVQLFIERVIRNLEPQVSSADIDASRWEWMKRYRLWEANRKVLLWPQDWYDPSLRDDQSPFFRQLMSTLLQGDITDDAAASAYLDYLTSLEEVAKLEPCGMYYQPGSPDANEASYVVARTSGASTKYYFRQLQDGGWTPWTQVMIDCDDMPLTPIVWNGRLFLFWLKAVKQVTASPAQFPDSASGTKLADLQLGDLNKYVTTAAGAAPTRSVVAQAALCWTEYYNGKWQPTKTSDVTLPTTIGTFNQPGYDGSFDAVRNRLSLVPVPFTGSNPAVASSGVQFSLSSEALVLAITVGDIPYNSSAGSGFSGGFILHNTHSLPIRLDDVTLVGSNGHTIQLRNILDLPAMSRAVIPDQSIPYSGTFQPYEFYIKYDNNSTSTSSATIPLNYEWMPRIVQPQAMLAGIWDAPFIYEDRRNLLYVTTTQSTGQVSGLQSFGRLVPTPVSPSAKIPPLLLGRTPGTPTIKATLALPAPFTYQGQVLSPVGDGTTGQGE
jgi:hypothetical protein